MKHHEVSWSITEHRGASWSIIITKPHHRTASWITCKHHLACGLFAFSWAVAYLANFLISNLVTLVVLLWMSFGVFFSLNFVWTSLLLFAISFWICNFCFPPPSRYPGPVRWLYLVHRPALIPTRVFLWRPACFNDDQRALMLNQPKSWFQFETIQPKSRWQSKFSETETIEEREREIPFEANKFEKEKRRNENTLKTFLSL